MTGLWTLMRRARARGRLAGRLPGSGEDRGSMTMALLVGVIGSGIAAILIPMLVMQIGSTSFDNSRAREMNAAEAGTSIGVGLIRSAIDGDGNGVVADLPCTSSPLTGTVDSSAGTLTYRVRINYYTQNPVDQTEDWLAKYSPAGQGHGMLCSQNAGTYYPANAPDNDSGKALQVPSWAVITSTGSDSRGQRTMRSIYTVQTTNANIAGGTLRLFGTSRCLDAGLAAGAVGYNVTASPCAGDPTDNSPASPAQAWVYRSDLTIQLVSSVTQSRPNGLCLDARYGMSTTSPQTAGDPVQLQGCGDLGSPPWYQQWSINGNGAFQGAAPPPPAGLGAYCIEASTSVAQLALGGCGGGSSDPTHTWVPSPDVGSGMAGPDTNQFVNFQNPSYCMDVTNESVTSTSTKPGGDQFLIAYSCKQDPDPCQVRWNQQFTMVGNHMVTYNNGNAGSCNVRKNDPYCLYAPSSPTGFPTVVSCTAPHLDTSRLTWTHYGATDSDGNPLTRYKYAIVNSDGSPPVDGVNGAPTDGVGSGLCLSMNGDPAVAFLQVWPKLVVAPCDGTKLQMWNGAPDTQPPTLTHFGEVSVPVSP